MQISRAQVQAAVRIYQVQGRTERGSLSAAKGGGGDRVDFSREARLLAQLRRRVADAPAIRSEKVNQLRELVARDEYDVSAEDIADFMLRRMIADRLQ